MKHEPIVYGPCGAVYATCRCGWNGENGHCGPQARAHAYTEAVMHCELADQFEVIVNAS